MRASTAVFICVGFLAAACDSEPNETTPTATVVDLAASVTSIGTEAPRLYTPPYPTITPSPNQAPDLIVERYGGVYIYRLDIDVLGKLSGRQAWNVKWSKNGESVSYATRSYPDPAVDDGEVRSVSLETREDQLVHELHGEGYVGLFANEKAFTFSRHYGDRPGYQAYLWSADESTRELPGSFAAPAPDGSPILYYTGCVGDPKPGLLVGGRPVPLPLALGESRHPLRWLTNDLIVGTFENSTGKTEPGIYSISSARAFTTRELFGFETSGRIYEANGFVASPNGEFVLYSRDRKGILRDVVAGTEFDFGIWTASATSWKPDSSMFAYLETDTGDLVVRRNDGVEVRRLPARLVFDGLQVMMDWSPTENIIALAVTDRSVGREVCT